MNMTSNEIAMHGQDWADKAADNVQGSIREAQQTANGASEKLSSKVETIRSQAAPSIKKVMDQAQAVVRQGMEAVSTAAQHVRDTSEHASDSVVAFTKENPIKTILMAAVSGALLLALFNALARSRE
jgi:ElaB/YqjD/DUF883 family membrane-anchored ribosome-binding protein